MRLDEQFKQFNHNKQFPKDATPCRELFGGEYSAPVTSSSGGSVNVFDFSSYTKQNSLDIVSPVSHISSLSLSNKYSDHVGGPTVISARKVRRPVSTALHGGSGDGSIAFPTSSPECVEPSVTPPHINKTRRVRRVTKNSTIRYSRDDFSDLTLDCSTR